MRLRTLLLLVSFWCVGLAVGAVVNEPRNLIPLIDWTAQHDLTTQGLTSVVQKTQRPSPVFVWVDGRLIPANSAHLVNTSYGTHLEIYLQEEDEDG